jgi:tetratricopeptide (TPR) repeat protein
MKPWKRAQPSAGNSAADALAGTVPREQGNLSQGLGEDALAAPPAQRPWWATALAATLIVLSAAAAYQNSFVGTYAYDDQGAIVENPTIRQLWPIWPVLSPPHTGETVSGRPLLNLTLAINYAISGLNVWSYHAANLAIHVAAALLLLGILRRTFLRPPLRDRFGHAAAPLALAGALLWAVHPLQTESVTYIAQRAESLAGFFYLLTLYGVIRGAGTVPFFASRKATMPGIAAGKKGDRPPRSADEGQGARGAGRGTSPANHHSQAGNCPPWPVLLWYAAAVLACLLGTACKEILVTAPLMVLLYDRTFLAGTFAEALRRRWGLYLGLAATWGLLAYLVFSTGLIARQAELGAPDPWSYARSEPGVILHYLRLSLWPNRLCMSYEWPVANTPAEILPGVMVTGMLLAATLWGLAARKPWGFLGAWFFLILAPTSSILPLNQLAHEHRMYLSLAAVVVLAVGGGYALWDRLLPRPALSGRRATAVRWAAPLAVWAGLLATLAWATVLRNSDYRSAISIWQDAVDKRPTNPFGHVNLGVALVAAGRTDEAIHHFQEALRLEPACAKAYNNLGLLLANSGKTSRAAALYAKALRLDPDDAAAHYNLANLLVGSGKTAEAIKHYTQALQLKPDHADAHYNLALVLAGLGRTDEAVEHYRQALRLKPDDAEAHNKLGLALAGAGRTDEAIEHLNQALRLTPAYADAHYNLANVLASAEKTSESIEHYDHFLQMRPDSTEGLNNLAWLLATHGPTAGGGPARAVRLAQRARELSGRENAPCLDTLAAAYAAAGRFSDAVIAAERAAALAEASGQAALTKNIRSRLELYRAGQPYREPPRAPEQMKP